MERQHLIELADPVRLVVALGRVEPSEVTAISFRSGSDEGLFIGFPPPANGVPLVRLHSGCVTGDIFGSSRCDCGPQLDAAWVAICARKAGGVLYLPGHEGRGIGLFQKLRAYGLQDAGLDTYAANERLGFAHDLRDYRPAAAALVSLGLDRIDLATNNPAKVMALVEAGVVVRRRVPLEAGVTVRNLEYLTAKRDRHGHRLCLDLGPEFPAEP